MNKATFYHDFPKDVDTIFDFPSHVVWSEKDISENVTLIKTDENSWFILAKEGKNPVLSCNITKEKGEEWKVSELEGSEVENLESQNFNDVWNFLVLHAMSLPVNRHSEDELPQPEFVQRIKSRMI